MRAPLPFLLIVCSACLWISEADYTDRVGAGGNDVDPTVDTDSDTDNGCTPVSWYADEDEDDFGNEAEEIEACDAPEGYVARAGDCDDADPAINPVSIEVCDDADTDEDCDGVSDDDDDSPLGTVEVWPDADGDGYGAGSSRSTCEPGADEVAIDGDCDDAVSTTFPGAPEYVDLVDSDCDGADYACGSTIHRVPTDHATVGDAVAAACAGDTIRVAAGSYRELVDLGNANLTLEGEGATTTTLDGFLNAGPVVSLSSGHVSGFTVTNGASASGHGVWVHDATDVLLEDLVLTGNTAVDGGGILVENSTSVAISACTFADNLSLGGGGGVAVLESTGVVVADSTFAGNEAIQGGGAYAFEGDVTLTGNTYVENQAQQGGGLALDQTVASVSGESFSANIGTSQGGAVWAELAEGTLSDLYAENDTAPLGAGAYAVGGAAFALEHSQFVGHGGASAVYLYDVTATDLAISDCAASPALSAKGQTLLSYLLVGRCGSGIVLQPVQAAATVSLDHAVVAGTDGDAVQLYYTTIDQITVTHAVLYDNLGAGLVGSNNDEPDVTWCAIAENEQGAVLGLADVSTYHGNMASEPNFVRYHRNLPGSSWDLHLMYGSPLVDTGNPAILESDGTVSDIGLHGGLLADLQYYEDVDADGLPDGWESAHGLDPTVDDAASDFDADGRDNATELANHTSPSATDTDGDGKADSLDAFPLDPTL